MLIGRKEVEAGSLIDVMGVLDLEKIRRERVSALGASP